MFNSTDVERPPSNIHQQLSETPQTANELDDEDYCTVTAETNPRLVSGVIVAVLMVIGFLGNSLVLYVYNFKMPRTVFSLFVTVLALLDLTTALVGMPIDVAIKAFLLPNNTPVMVICKIAHLENYGASLTSGSVLLLIAVTRHRKVCQPLEPSLTCRSARVMCGVIFVVSMLLCSVTLVINGLETVRIGMGHKEVGLNSSNSQLDSTDDGLGNLCQKHLFVNGSDKPVQATMPVSNITRTVREVVEVNICRTSEEQKQTVLYYILTAILILAFVSIFLLLVILHWRISHTVKKFQRRQSRMRFESIYSNDSTHINDNINSRMFRIFASITVVFLVSYLPHLICLILERSIFTDGEPMSQTARILMDLAYNSPYINVIANPFIYGYRSDLFREHCIALFKRCCCWCCWYRKY